MQAWLMEVDMDLKLFKTLAGVSALALGYMAMPAHAQLTGSIEAKLTLTSTCTINSVVFPNASTPPAVTYTALDFGTATTAFTELLASTSLTYTCSAGSSPKITLGQGFNWADDQRAMKLGATSHVVKYELYTEASRLVPLPLDGVIPLTGDNTSTTLNIYARAFGSAGLSVGAYTDSITVTLAL
jgi:spore coat protein U-like protein